MYGSEFVCNKSQLFKYVEDRKALVSKIERFSAECDVENLLESIERFHNLTSKISTISMECLNQNHITLEDYNRIRDETNEMYPRIKRMINENLKQRCDVEWYAV